MTIGKLVATVEALTVRIQSLETTVRDYSRDMKQCYTEQSDVIDDQERRLLLIEERHKGEGKWGDSARGMLFAVIGGLIMAAATMYVR